VKGFPHPTSDAMTQVPLAAGIEQIAEHFPRDQSDHQQPDNDQAR
jgi:hypothetical protein